MCIPQRQIAFLAAALMLPAIYGHNHYVCVRMIAIYLNVCACVCCISVWLLPRLQTIIATFLSLMLCSYFVIVFILLYLPQQTCCCYCCFCFTASLSAGEHSLEKFKCHTICCQNVMNFSSVNAVGEPLLIQSVRVRVCCV